jgi:uncharacterized membrane protein/thiol-disulfide isomerase/thioredoxin
MLYDIVLAKSIKEDSQMRKLLLPLAIVLILACLATPFTTAAQSPDEAVVRAILFYSPTCPACHQLIEELLAPMAGDYGNRLQIKAIDTSQSAGLQLYNAAVQRYQIQQQGVPTLVVSDVVLIGSGEIPDQFPSLVEEGLASGGISWPDIPGLDQVPPEVQMTIGSEGLQAVRTEGASTGLMGRTLTGGMLGGMIAALVYGAWRVKTAWQNLAKLFQSGRKPLPHAETWAIPILALVGLGIATYLSYVEITHVEAICGPISGCNFVQSSPYARILNIPVAVLGVLYYLGIGVLWAGQRSLSRRWANRSVLGLLGLTFIGILFSIYLTFLEIFVVRAICMWCLGSALAATVLMLLVVVSATRSPLPKRGRR